MMKYFFIAIILCSCNALWSQQRSQQFDDSRGNVAVDSTETSDLPDSISLRYFMIDNLDQYYDYNDSLLDYRVHNYDPARREEIDYIHLGNQGSAASALRYEAKPKVGFTEGHKQYDLYNFELEDFKFFEGNVPLLQAEFSPMGSQDNFVIRADFTREFSGGVTVSSNYQRVSQVGLYANQRTKITNFGVSIKYDHPGKRYTGFLSMISNVGQEENNGGPLDLNSLIEISRGNREVISTSLSGATTRHQQKYYSLINYYKLNSKQSQLDLRLRYDIGYDASYIKYSDPDIDNVNDRKFYGEVLAVDFRGLRNYTRVNKINNAFYVFLSDKKRLNVRAGIVYDRYSIEQDILESAYDNIYLDLDGSIPFIKGLGLITKAQIGIGDGVGDFNIDGALDVNIGKIGTLRGGLAFYRESPTLLQQSYYLTQDTIWNNNLLKPVGSKIYGKVSIPSLKLEASVEQHLVDNAIYFDTLAMPVQSTELYSATVFTLQNSMSYSIFNLQNTFLVQLINENIFGLPTYFSKHNFFLESPMFKGNLQSRWGVETRVTPSYDGLAYNPAIGTFHLSKLGQTPFYPTTDIYFSGKVKKFKLFVKLENLNQIINKTEVDFRVENYPQQDWRIRFGIFWLFLG